MPEYFLNALEVEKVVIVNDFRFLPEGQTEMVEVKPVKWEKLVEDQKSLKGQVLYVFPQAGDFEKRIFYVHYLSNKTV
jgi:hypothetical protein